MEPKKVKKSLFLKGDGWQNLMTGAGRAGYDKRTGNKHIKGEILDDETLTSLYREDGIATRIVDIVPQDMVRNWFHVEGDTDNSIIKYLDKLKAKKHVKTALRWARLYGGSILMMGIDDGKKAGNALERPLAEDNIKKIGFFRVYDKRQITVDEGDIDKDPTSENYGKPKLYKITPRINVTDSAFKVHYSRVIRFIGSPLPENESAEMDGWGDSELQKIYERLKGFADAMVSTEDILSEFIIGVLRIKNLGDLIAAGKESQILTRLNQIDQSKHIMNTMLVDEEEEYNRTAATVNGIKDLLEFFKDVLSATSGIPQIKLFGEQSKGLGAQAAGNIRLYYDDVADKQEEELKPVVERLVELVIKTGDFSAKKSQKLDSANVVFNSLWQDSNKEIAEARHTQAKADEIYIKNGVTDPEEIAKSRFGGKTYSFETVLDPKKDSFRKKMSENMTKEKKDVQGKRKDDKDTSGASDAE